MYASVINRPKCDLTFKVKGQSFRKNALKSHCLTNYWLLTMNLSHTTVSTIYHAYHFASKFICKRICTLLDIIS